MKVALVVGLALLAVLPAVLEAQESRVRFEVALGGGVLSAQSPYRTDPIAAGRAAIVLGSTGNSSVEVSGLLLGVVGAGDSFGEPPIPRPIPNTLGLTVGSLWRRGTSPWSASFGLGAYHVESRASVPGATTLGLHAGIQRRLARASFGAAVFDARMIVLPSINGSRVWAFPVGLALRSR